MERHCSNAQKVAEYLSSHEKVNWVTYPGLPGDANHELAQKYLPNGSCGVISFGVKGGRDGAEAFMKRLKVAMIATHVADAHTCVLHPANATHRQLSDEELAACGVGADMIRLSVGIEHVDDILADLEQALAAI
jgi:O-acetylhomoserine (thiol)-lyase